MTHIPLGAHNMRALCNCYQQSLSCVHCLLAAPAVAASFAPRQASGHPPHELLKTTPTLARRLLLVALQDLRGPLPELRDGESRPKAAGHDGVMADDDKPLQDNGKLGMPDESDRLHVVPFNTTQACTRASLP